MVDLRGCTPDAHPPWPKIFAISCSFLGKFGPLLESWCPLLWGILDPPLICHNKIPVPIVIALFVLILGIARAGNPSYLHSVSLVMQFTVR